MKTIVTTAAIILLLVLWLQTSASARANRVSVACEPAEGESAECLSLGPLGGVNPSGIRFWITSFIHHGAEIPRELQDVLRDELR